MLRKIKRRLIGAIVVAAAIVGILANWEAAVRGFQRLMAWF